MTKVIYTCITGGKDTLDENINAEGAKLICFTDKKMKSKNWEIIVLPKIFKDVRRNSRLAKILPHIYLPRDTEYSLYLDGNISLKVPVQELIDDWLENDEYEFSDMALFGHNSRDCYFDEAKECIRLGLDDEETIIQQMIRYHEYPKHAGLFQGGVLLRKHTDQLREFNEAWWVEYCAGSKRDQLSMPIARLKTGLIINSVVGHAFNDERFEMIPHLKPSEWHGKAI